MWASELLWRERFLSTRNAHMVLSRLDPGVTFFAEAAGGEVYCSGALPFASKKRQRPGQSGTTPCEGFWGSGSWRFRYVCSALNPVSLIKPTNPKP